MKRPKCFWTDGSETFGGQTNLATQTRRNPRSIPFHYALSKPRVSFPHPFGTGVKRGWIFMFFAGGTWGVKCMTPARDPKQKKYDKSFKIRVFWAENPWQFSGFFRRSFCEGRELRRPKSDHVHPGFSCFFPKMIPKWSQNDPKMIPKLSQNDPKIIPKWSQNDPKIIPKMFPKWSYNDPKMIPKLSQNDAKISHK